MIKKLPRHSKAYYRNNVIQKMFLLVLLCLSVHSLNAQIDSEDFEGGWGIWNDGGGDCRRANNLEPNLNFAIELRDNSGAASSMTTDNINLTGYSDVTISFNYHGASMENNEDFFVRFSNNGGTNWTTIGTYVVNVDFTNGVDDSASINIDTATYNFTANSQFRIQCDASGNGDLIYIDDVVLTGTPIAGPANDDCANAITLPVNNSCVFSTYTNQGATDSGVADPGCANYSGGDVWFTVTVPATGQVDIDTDDSGVITDSGMAVYSGTCGALTLIECDDDGSPTGFLMSYISVTGRTPGETLYIRVWEYGNDNNGTFDICVSTPPACTAPDAPTNLVFGTPGSNTIDGSFTASAPAAADNYLVLVSTSNVQPTVTDGTTYNIGDTFGAYTVVDNDANTTFTATGLNASTQYYFYIFGFNDNGCAGGPTYSTTSLNGTETTDVPTICIPNSTVTSNYIDDFATLNGTTNITNNNTGFSAGGYGDFTAQSVTQVAGSSIDITANLTYGFGGMGVGAWVDWNNDLDFNDPGETIYLSNAYITTVNFNYIIPGATPAGSYRLRILADYWETTVDPCSFDPFGPSGEAEDYTLVVTPLTCTDDPINVSATTTSLTTATLSWTDPVPAPANGYEYIVSLDNSTSTPGDDITGTTTGNTVNLTGLTSGTTYYVFVRSDCGGGDYGIWLTTIFDTCAVISNTPNSCEMIISEQGSDPFAITPFDSDPSFTLDCAGGSVTLETFAQMNETTSYSVEKIPYQLIPPIGLGINNESIPSDDVWAALPADIEFPFCFYDNEYDYTLVGANGMITFDIDYAPFGLTGSNTPGSSCGWQFSNDLPSTVGALFEQTIYGVYHDVDPFGEPADAITTRVQGAVGCRKFIAEWNDIPMFGDATREYSGMIVLYETTNIIEVYIEEKVIENGDVSPWNDGNAIVGVQGDITPLAPNNEYTVAPCRNGLDTNWETTNEAWRFTPSGNSRLTTVEWYNGTDTSGSPDHTGNTYNVSAGGTYTAVSTYTTCSGGTVTLSDEVVVVDNRKVWLGGDTTVGGNIDPVDWMNPENWTNNTIPNATDCVIIPVTGNDPILYNGDDGDGLNMAIYGNAVLTVETGASVTIQDYINLQSTSEIYLENSASLVQVVDGAANVNNNFGTGIIRMDRETNVRNTDYVYWSSPASGFGVTNVYGANTPTAYIYEWTTTIPNGFTPPPDNIPICYGDWSAFGGTMANGKGYIVRAPNGHPAGPSIATATFTGLPNNGVITQAITSGNNNISNNNFTYNPYGVDVLTVTPFDDNWNLIGNPYPSGLDADKFLTDNTIIEGAVHIWTHGSALGTYTDSFYDDFALNYNQNDYITYNLTGISNPNPTFNGYVGAGQGFFVLALNDNETGSVTFNNTMRSKDHDNSDFFRTSSDSASSQRNDNTEKHRIWLNLISEDQLASSILVGYIEGATYEKDRLYDAYTFETNVMSLYSKIEDERMIIQGRQLPFDVNDQVPLGIDILEDGNYTIAISDVDGLFEGEDGQNIYLEDTYTGFIHDLRINPYTFNIEAGIYEDRFILRYTDDTLSVNQFENDSDLIIYVEDNLIKVKSERNLIESVVIYDVLGRRLISVDNVNDLNKVFYNLRPSDGVLFVKARLTDGREKTKKVIY
ncbi:GEVED domain-containing protein [Winogradskyella sp. 3972H.M.0a.05]|uniref:GEVED domain-containing protein n=1 Tax=Winogradskyella sp. 3972H.M.0a.05 TaxID=2950277 RepID=UPI00339213E9